MSRRKELNETAEAFFAQLGDYNVLEGYIEKAPLVGNARMLVLKWNGFVLDTPRRVLVADGNWVRLSDLRYAKKHKTKVKLLTTPNTVMFRKVQELVKIMAPEEYFDRANKNVKIIPAVSN